MDSDLAGEVALVAGAAGGIGGAVVDTLAAGGAIVVGIDRVSPTASRVAAEVVGDLTDAAVAVRAVAVASELGDGSPSSSTRPAAAVASGGTVPSTPCRRKRGIG